MNVIVTQNNSATEQVGSAVIEKLYQLATNGLDSSSNLVGRLHTTATYRKYVDVLTERFKNLYITADKYYVWFEDPIVRSLCVEKWGDGVGLVESDLSNIFDYDYNMFQGKDISTFDEFKLFNRITYIKDYSFQGCQNLQSISIPNSCTELRQQCFSDCTNLQNVEFPSSITTLRFRCFWNCPKLRQLDLSNVSIFDGEEIMQGITSWDRPLVMPNMVGGSSSTFCKDPFMDSTIKQIYLKNLVSPSPECYFDNWWDHSSGFGGTRTYVLNTDLIYLKNVQKLYPGSFCGMNCPAVVINNMTPPVCCNTNDQDTPPNDTQSKVRTFTSVQTVTIYVPDAALNDYKSADVWKDNTSIIHGISELNGGIKYATEEDWEAAGKPVALIEEYM